MKKGLLRDMAAAELVELFALHALEQDKALLWDDTAKFRLLYRHMEEIEQELKSRPGDQRQRLLDLFQHENIQVRLKAAEATLAGAPEKARQMLEMIASSLKFPQAGHAGMTIAGLDDGTFKPT